MKKTGMKVIGSIVIGIILTLFPKTTNSQTLSRTAVLIDSTGFQTREIINDTLVANIHQQIVLETESCSTCFLRWDSGDNWSQIGYGLNHFQVTYTKPGYYQICFRRYNEAAEVEHKDTIIVKIN